jgi:hypothetical protein
VTGDKVNREEEYVLRIAAIHGIGPSTAYNMPLELEKRDIRYEEFRAMVEAFLEPGYDPAKIARVEDAQIDLHRSQNLLEDDLDAGRIGPEEYLVAVNKLIAETFAHCESILGPDDFHRLFEDSPVTAGGSIERQPFLESTRGETA